MVLLGLLLIVGAAAAGVFLYLGSSAVTDTVELSALGITIGLPPVALVIAGAVTIGLLWLGWALLRTGIKRSARRRREAKESARVAKEQQAVLERQAADRQTGTSSDMSAKPSRFAGDDLDSSTTGGVPQRQVD